MLIQADDQQQLYIPFEQFIFFNFLVKYIYSFTIQDLNQFIPDMHKQITKKVALYGGAFDPPHKGHFFIIQNLATFNKINQVWLLPCGDRDDKKLLFTKDERFNLLNKLISKIKMDNKSSNINKIEISSQEIQLSKKQKRMIPTIQLLEHLQKKYNNYEFYFIIGADLLETINTWHHYQRLLKQHQFIIYPRQGYDFPIDKKDQATKKSKEISQNKKTLYIPQNYYFNNFLAPLISSSSIKKTLFNQKLSKEQRRQKIEEFLDESVLKALQEKQYI